MLPFGLAPSGEWALLHFHHSLHQPTYVSNRSNGLTTQYNDRRIFQQDYGNRHAVYSLPGTVQTNATEGRDFKGQQAYSSHATLPEAGIRFVHTGLVLMQHSRSAQRSQLLQLRRPKMLPVHRPDVATNQLSNSFFHPQSDQDPNQAPKQITKRNAFAGSYHPSIAGTNQPPFAEPNHLSGAAASGLFNRFSRRHVNQPFSADSSHLFCERAHHVRWLTVRRGRRVCQRNMW